MAVIAGEVNDLFAVPVIDFAEVARAAMPRVSVQEVEHFLACEPSVCSAPANDVVIPKGRKKPGPSPAVQDDRMKTCSHRQVSVRPHHSRHALRSGSTNWWQLVGAGEKQRACRKRHEEKTSANPDHPDVLKWASGV